MVMKEALRVSELTGRSLRYFRRPRLWISGDLGPVPDTTTIPSDEDIRSRLDNMGYTHLELQEHPPAMRKRHSDSVRRPLGHRQRVSRLIKLPII